MIVKGCRIIMKHELDFRKLFYEMFFEINDETDKLFYKAMIEADIQEKREKCI